MSSVAKIGRFEPRNEMFEHIKCCDSYFISIDEIQKISTTKGYLYSGCKHTYV